MKYPKIQGVLDSHRQDLINAAEANEELSLHEALELCSKIDKIDDALYSLNEGAKKFRDSRSDLLDTATKALKMAFSKNITEDEFDNMMLEGLEGDEELPKNLKTVLKGSAKKAAPKKAALRSSPAKK